MPDGFSFTLYQKSGTSRDDLVEQTASVRGHKLPKDIVYFPSNVESRTVQLDTDALTRVAAVFAWAKSIRDKAEE